MTALIAHAGHWLESAAFALPPVLMIALVLGAALLARRNERLGADSDRGTGG